MLKKLFKLKKNLNIYQLDALQMILFYYFFLNKEKMI